MDRGNLGKRVRALRTDRDLSQEALAREAGVSLNLVNKLERGVVTDPHYSTLSGIARALGVPVEELMREPVPLAEAPEAGRLEEEPSPAVEVQERREPGVKPASAHIHGQGSLRAEGTVLRIASPDLQAIIRGAVRGELSEEEAMAAAHEKAETV
jgi:transcriptional regulator with XRE-family HTH domain